MIRIDWRTLTGEDLRELDPESTVVLLPVAAVEQHGPHLPLGTDALIARGIVDNIRGDDRSATTLLTLPPMEVGHSLEHRSFPGTLTLDAETLAATWTDVGRSVARCGLRKLLILNAHGGQSWLVDLVALRLRSQLDMLVARCNYFAFGAPPGLFEDQEMAHGIHGGEVETSLMLHLHPDLVRRQHLADFGGLTFELAQRNRILGVEAPVGFGWLSQDLNPEGVCGNAAAADATRGARLLRHLGDRLAELVEEMAATPLSLLRDGPKTGKHG